MKNKKSTAVRLDRFKPWADTWKQRRSEDAFAVQANCIAENRRATKSARWNDMKKHVFRGVSFYVEPVKRLTPENIKKEFEYQRIDSNLYQKAVSFLRMIEQETTYCGGLTDELHLCRVMLNNVISKVPDHLRK